MFESAHRSEAEKQAMFQAMQAAERMMPRQMPWRSMSAGRTEAAMADRTTDSTTRRETAYDEDWAGQCLFDYYNG